MMTAILEKGKVTQVVGVVVKAHPDFVLVRKRRDARGEDGVALGGDLLRLARSTSREHPEVERDGTQSRAPTRCCRGHRS